jgi:carbon monoxide dehydrogenase subunit G
MLKPFSNFVAAIIFIVSPVFACAAPPGGRDISVHVERDGNAFVVAAELTVAASTDEVWDVLTDFDHMAQILSNVDLSRVANRNGKRFEVIQKAHGSFGLIHFSVDSVRAVELTPKREIHSHLIKGDLKSSDFTTRIAKKGGITRITVSGKIVAEGLSAGAITPEAVQAQTQRQYQELREEILRRKAKEPPPCLLAKNCAQVSG